MIDTVIFDIGKVLMDYSWDQYLHGIVPDEIPYRTLEEAVFLNPCWEEHDKGLMTEEEELWDFISNAPDYEPEIRAVYENLGQCTWSFSYANAWIGELKARGLKVYALSNWQKRIFEQNEETMMGFLGSDGWISSFLSNP